MQIFDYLEEYDFEQLTFCYDRDSGLKAIIGIHNTALGPALGGTRIWDYNSEKDAITDVLRLAKGMTYKNAAAGLNLGGGKTVIIGDPAKIKSKRLFQVLGRYVEGLNGRYITAEDMNATTKDMSYVNEETDYVVGLEGKSGNPAPITAFGVFRGIQAAINEVFGSDELRDKIIAVQGLGEVGHRLCRHLYDAGAKLYVTDIRKEKIEELSKELNAIAADPDEIHKIECDVFAPCAMGAIINDFTVEQLGCKIVAGSANNQLAEEKHGEILMQKGILYVPDFVINSGGVINVYEEMRGYNKEKALARASMIYDSVKEIFKISKKENISTNRAAEKMAETRIKGTGGAKNIYLKKQ